MEWAGHECEGCEALQARGTVGPVYLMAQPVDLYRSGFVPVEMGTASRRQSATTRVRGSIGSAEIFAEGMATKCKPGRCHGQRKRLFIRWSKAKGHCGYVDLGADARWVAWV
jgi:hypothetical protein